MNCHNARVTFPELLDRRTPATAQLEARAHLAGCPDCQREFAELSRTLSALDAMPPPNPSPRLRQNFYAMLEEEKHSAASVRAATERQYRARRASLWRWVLSPLAGVALVALGFFAGQRSSAPVVANTKSENSKLSEEVQELKAQVTAMNKFVATEVLKNQKQPGNERLRGVFASATQESPDDRAINELLSALAFDSSANVRLRALEGLSAHADKEVVRAGVLASLTREENPLVQVSMIDFLAAARDTEAKPALERLSLNETADKNVRDAARRALTQF